MLLNMLTQVQSSAGKDVNHKCGRIPQEKGHSGCALSFFLFFSFFFSFCIFAIGHGLKQVIVNEGLLV